MAAYHEVDENSKASSPPLVAKLMSGPHTKKQLLLTFDDGPHPGYTPELLKLLKEEKVKAVFFVIGKMVEKNPSLARAIVNAGHELGNHTFSHATLTKLPYDEMVAEYRANDRIVEKVTGVRMLFARPPGGIYNTQVIDAAEAEGLTTVLWTDDPADYERPDENLLLRKTLDKMRNGGIVLLHDGVPQTLHILKQLIETARAEGYTFVSPREWVPEKHSA
jgi:peptidoglycan/xylan/chitin deacetylase (PgdA/CDA1 family)